MLNQLLEISRTSRTPSPRSFLPTLSQLEPRITPVTRSTLASIVNASPVVFTNQTAVVAQWTLDTTTTYGTVVCFGFTQPDLVRNTQFAYLEHLVAGKWVRLETVRPEPTRIFLDRFGVQHTENPHTFRLLIRPNPNLTTPVVDVDIRNFGFTGTNGTVTYRGVSHVRLVQSGRMLSTTGLLYLAGRGSAQPIADINVGINPGGIRALVLHAKAGSNFNDGTNYRLYRLADNGTPVGTALGTLVRSSDGKTLVWYLYQRVDVAVMKFRVFADVSSTLQAGSFYATT